MVTVGRFVGHPPAAGAVVAAGDGRVVVAVERLGDVVDVCVDPPVAVRPPVSATATGPDTAPMSNVVAVGEAPASVMGATVVDGAGFDRRVVGVDPTVASCSLDDENTPAVARISSTVASATAMIPTPVPADTALHIA